MSLNLSGSAHLLGSNPLGQSPAYPLFLGIFAIPSLGQNRRYISVFNSTDPLNVVMQVGTDVSPGATNKASAEVAVPGPTGAQALSSVAIDNTSWQFIYGGFTSASSRLAGWGLGHEGTSGTGPFTPSGINRTAISGRGSDFTSGVGGNAAHAVGFARVPSSIERAYLASGKNPRALKGLARYWKLLALTGGQTIITDEMGNEPLTIVGSVASGSGDPNFATFMMASPIAGISVAAGAALTPFDLGALFDNVSSAYVCSLRQLGVATQVTTTNGTTSATGREVILNSSAAFTAGDYIGIGNAQPSQVLYVDNATGTVLFADDRSWTNGLAVYRYSVTALAIPGWSINSNVLSGSTTSTGVRSQCFVRAACAANAGLFGDSNLFPISVGSTLPVTFARPRGRKRSRFVKIYTRR